MAAIPRNALLVALLPAVLAGGLLSAQHDGAHRDATDGHGAPAEAGDANAPYAGLQHRSIAGLSAKDVAALRRGDGWGLALPAELNGVPGPKHVLELRDELELEDDQAVRIEAIYKKMRRDAIAAGERLIAAEAALSDAFRNGGTSSPAGPHPERLQALLEEAEAARAALRFVHLSSHLAVAEILTGAQISRYAFLRGYSDSAPCAAVPDGHDAQMWRRHNGCE